MTATRVAALVMIPLAIVVGVLGGRFWNVAHMAPGPAHVASLADHPADAVSDRPAPPRPVSPPSPTLSDPQGAAREKAVPPVASLPGNETPKPPVSASNGAPSFDVVRVEPKGDTVVAGKGAPNAKVALLSEGKVVGEAKSDASGQFVILPERLAPGDHALTLRQMPAGAPARESKQSVAVSVPQPREGASKDKVVVALAEPGKATKLLSPPPGTTTGAASKTAPSGKVLIRSAELENGNGIYVSGAARAGTSVHVYLNDSHIADVVAGADDAWSVRVKHGLTGGHYSVRADAAGADGKIASRAEVPFDVPTLMAQAEKPSVAPPAPAVSPDAKTAADTPAGGASSGTATSTGTATARAVDEARPSTPDTPKTAAAATVAPAPTGADATIDTVATARVTRGDNLWNISRFRLGDGQRYTQIYAANVDQIRDPNLIYPGQVFVVPTR